MPTMHVAVKVAAKPRTAATITARRTATSTGKLPQRLLDLPRAERPEEERALVAVRVDDVGRLGVRDVALRRQHGDVVAVPHGCELSLSPDRPPPAGQPAEPARFPAQGPRLLHRWFHAHRNENRLLRRRQARHGVSEHPRLARAERLAERVDKGDDQEATAKLRGRDRLPLGVTQPERRGAYRAGRPHGTRPGLHGLERPRARGRAAGRAEEEKSRNGADPDDQHEGPEHPAQRDAARGCLARGHGEPRIRVLHVSRERRTIGGVNRGGHQMGVGATTLGELAQSVQGEVVARGDARYDEARALYNGMIDKRPQAIVYCEDVAAVTAAGRYAGEQALRVTAATSSQ